MAEVVATVLGVTSSVAQLTEAVMKLRNIYASFKNASTNLAELDFEIFIVAEQFERSKKRIESASLLDDILVARCAKYLGEVLDAVRAVTGEIQKAFNRRRLIGVMKFVWQRDQLQGLKEKLARAQHLMYLTERDIDRAQHDLLQ